MWHGASSPSPRLRGEGRGEGAWPQAETEGPRPLTLARGACHRAGQRPDPLARSTSPRKRGEVKAVPHAIALSHAGEGREGTVTGTTPATTRVRDSKRLKRVGLTMPDAVRLRTREVIE